MPFIITQTLVERLRYYLLVALLIATIIFILR